MNNYGLPRLPENNRWYLAHHSKKYAALKVQKEVWWGWKDVAEELVCITGKPLPFDIAMKEAANDIIRILNAPKVDYGVVN